MSHLPVDRIPYTAGPAAQAKARFLLTHFDGAVDAGFTGRIAVDQLLRVLPSQRVVTFSSDALIDYRAHRPVVTVENWMSSSMQVPQIVVDLVHDDAGTPLWILHGPEPDLRWEALAATLADLATDAGVEMIVSLHGIPSSVPHTRPVQVHAHATKPDLLPEQPELPGPMQMQASLSGFLLERLREVGIDGMSLLPTVPYYVGDTPYPPAAVAMLSHLSSVTGLALPVGDLEQGSHSDREAIDTLVGKNPEISAMIEQLERTFDDLEAQGKLPHLASAWDDAAAVLTDPHPADAVDSVEAFLENIARLEADEATPLNVGDILPTTAEHALEGDASQAHEPAPADAAGTPVHESPAAPGGESAPAEDAPAEGEDSPFQGEDPNAPHHADDANNADSGDAGNAGHAGASRSLREAIDEVLRRIASRGQRPDADPPRGYQPRRGKGPTF